MTLEEIELVQESWQKVVPMQDAAAKLFYFKLFELDPSLQSLFKDDLGEQRRTLMVMINTAVNGLSDLDEIVPALEWLGRRHAGYGVKVWDYETAGEALLWTLQQALGEEFTPQIAEAWAATYSLLATTMKRAGAVIMA